jgi:hypothetical protein
MSDSVNIGQTKITFDPNTGDLIIFNRQNVPVHIELRGESKLKNFEINIAKLEITNDGLIITGRSGRNRIIDSKQLNQLINFANDTTKINMEPPFKSTEKIGLISVDIYVHARKVKSKIMEKIVKLTESDLTNIIKKVLSEQREENYMFFSNLEQMKRQIDMLLELEPGLVDEIIQNGHDWADDHISEAKTNMDQVFDFLMNETRKMKSYIEYEDITEGKKKTGTKLCSRGKSAAKAKFKVYPSAYANGYAVQVCKGKMPGLDGKKHCSGSYC